MPDGLNAPRSDVSDAATGKAAQRADIAVGKQTLTEAVSPGRLTVTTADVGAVQGAGSKAGTSPPLSQLPTAASEDARVAATAGKPQLAQHGHAMQYYRLHQPAFLDAVRARLLAANLAPGSPGLSWTNGAARFIEHLGFALTGPEARELPELLYPSDPWMLIDAHRKLDADPTAGTGAMTWAPAAGLAIAGAVEQTVRACLPRVAARYVAEQGARSASILVAAHPMDRVIAEALIADGVVTLGARKEAKAPVGYDVQTEGIRLVTAYHWLGDTDPTLWNWIGIDEPVDATLEEIAFTIWSRSDYAYGLTRVGGYVAVPKEWASQVPGVRARDGGGGATLERFERSPVEQLAASKLADGVALVEGAHAAEKTTAAAKPGARPAAKDVAPERAQLLDTLDSSATILDELQVQLAPWGLASAVETGRAFVARQRTNLPGAAPDDIALWAPVLTGQHAIVTEAASGLLQAVQLLANAGVSPAQLSPMDRTHPGLQVLYGYAQAAGTAQLIDSARGTLAQAKAAHAMLPVNLIARTSQDAGRELSQLGRSGETDRVAAIRAREFGADQAQLAGEVATLQSQMMATGKPDPALLETAGLDAETLGFRAHIANLRAGLGALGTALDAADEGVIATIANLSARTRMIMTGHHLDLASAALGGVETTLDNSQPAVINARYDAMPPSADREYMRQFELRQTRKAQLGIAHERFATVVKLHGLEGPLFKEAEQALHDAQIRALVTNIVVLLAVGVVSGGVAAVAGDFAAGLVGGGRVVATIGEAGSALRTARVVGGITNVVVDAGVTAGAQTALNGDQMGSSFAENLVTNVAVRAALRPLHAVIRTWGGLDEEAYALWAQQGARGKIALAKTATVTAELVTAAATGYAVHRLATLARGQKPDDETIASWAIQGATLVLARLINTRLNDSIERLRAGGALAGELVARMHSQRRLAQAVSDADRIDGAVAMQLLANHQQTLHDEIEFWRKVANDPEAMRTLGLDRGQVAAKFAAAEAQGADTQGKAFNYLPLRFAGLMQEIEGGRLWVGDPEQVAEAIANARAAKLHVEVAPPPDGGQGPRVWRVTLNGEAVEIRERARPSRARTATAGHSDNFDRREQRTGGRYGILDDPTEEIINDPDPTPEVRKLCDEARAAHPDDVEAQRDYIWKQLKTGDLRKSLLARGQTDVKAVSKALQDFGVAEATPKAIAEIRRYIFDSSGIAFSYENYASWSRLAAGRGRVTDARFLVHELTEVGLLKKDAVDFMGRSLKVGSQAHERWATDTFEPAYMKAHKQALRSEHQFLGDQIARLSGEQHRLPPEVIAAIAATFDENSAQACRLMDTADGPTVHDHPSFKSWQGRATEPVELAHQDATRLGLLDRTTLAELIRAVRDTRLSSLSAQATRHSQ